MATDAAPPGPDRKPQRPPASTDVARLAGVSQKTVSRVMNDEPHVKDDVRERVLRAAAELGYRRNSAARALISGRTRRIGVVSLGTALFGPATVLVSFERAARRQGYALSLANTFEGDAGGISGALDELLEQGVDGIILSEPIDEGPLHLDVHVPVLGHIHFATSVFFDIGVYLIVVALVLEILRSLGAELDRQHDVAAREEKRALERQKEPV